MERKSDGDEEETRKENGGGGGGGGKSEREWAVLRVLPLGADAGNVNDDGECEGEEKEEEEEYSEDIRRRNMRRNLHVTIGLRFTRGFGVSSWTGTPNAALLQHICHGRVWGLGFASGAMGISQLMFALPLGYLGDKRRSIRARMMSVAGVVQMGAIVLLLFTVTSKSMEEPGSLLPLWLITLGLAGLGYVIASMQSLGQSLLADSLVTQQRQEAYTRVQIYSTCGLSLGPFLVRRSIFRFYPLPSRSRRSYRFTLFIHISPNFNMMNPVCMCEKIVLSEQQQQQQQQQALLIFRHFGNTWSVESIRTAVEVGVCTLIPSTFFLCSFTDNIELSSKRHRRKKSSSSSSLASMRKNDSGESLSTSSGAPSLVEGIDGTEEDEEEVLFDETEAIGYGHIRVNGGDGHVEDTTPVNGYTERTPLLGSHLPSPKLSHSLRTLSLSSSLRKLFGPESVPLLLFLSDLVISMASGMTLRYACIYIYIYMCVCVCVCGVYTFDLENTCISISLGDD